jgi:hypothetical protein
MYFSGHFQDIANVFNIFKFELNPLDNKKDIGLYVFFRTFHDNFQVKLFPLKKCTVAFKWCVPSASDVFLSKNDNSGGKTREASEGVEYGFCFTEYEFCPVWCWLFNSKISLRDAVVLLHFLKINKQMIKNVAFL